MAQYIRYNPDAYSYVTDTLTDLRVRFGQRDGKYVEDREITPSGFLFAEDVGWKNIKELYAPIVGNRYRIGVRIEAYVIDVESGTNWENLQESKIE